MYGRKQLQMAFYIRYVFDSFLFYCMQRSKKVINYELNRRHKRIALRIKPGRINCKANKHSMNEQHFWKYSVIGTSGESKSLGWPHLQLCMKTIKESIAVKKNGTESFGWRWMKFFLVDNPWMFLTDDWILTFCQDKC